MTKREGFTPLENKSRNLVRKGSLTGFTLVEIMIVLAIVMTLATLVVSSVLRARHNANEMAAVAACKTIVTACQNFYANNLPHAYPASLSDLISPLSNPPYIDSVLASGTKQGYNFTYAFIDTESFILNAEPAVSGKTGSRNFFVNESGIIKAKLDSRAGPDDPAVE
ncbi:MAG: type II secretion system protein [Candidatus Omnitrophota bacterium]|nr:type II secretion system protein [Candidatus Omnitrophota bacterium]